MSPILANPTTPCYLYLSLLKGPPMTTSDRAHWLQGPVAHCTAHADKRNPAWRLVLLGPPGVGKGTQAQLFHHQLGACHLSTGDVFRSAASRKDCVPSPAMAAALEFMRRGELVPDDTVWEMVRERLDYRVQREIFLLEEIAEGFGLA